MTCSASAPVISWTVVVPPVSVVLPFLEEDAKSGVIFLPAAVVLPHRFHLDAVHDITVPSHRLNVRLSA